MKLGKNSAILGKNTTILGKNNAIFSQTWKFYLLNLDFFADLEFFRFNGQFFQPIGTGNWTQFFV